MPAPSSRDSGFRARRVGRRGERVAVRWLKRHGYRVHARNLRTPRGEVDVLAEERGCLVLVEVKSTARPQGRRALPPVRRRQRERLRAVAQWLRNQPGLKNARIRHDLVVVTLDGRRSVVTIRRDVFRA